MFLSNKTHLSKWTKMLKTNGELKETTLKHTGKKKMLTLGFLTVQKNNKNLLGELFLEKGGLLNLRDT